MNEYIYYEIAEQSIQFSSFSSFFFNKYLYLLSYFYKRQILKVKHRYFFYIKTSTLYFDLKTVKYKQLYLFIFRKKERGLIANHLYFNNTITNLGNHSSVGIKLPQLKY